jgi:hypothetical protein
MSLHPYVSRVERRAATINKHPQVNIPGKIFTWQCYSRRYAAAAAGHNFVLTVLQYYFVVSHIYMDFTILFIKKFIILCCLQP